MSAVVYHGWPVARLSDAAAIALGETPLIHLFLGEDAGDALEDMPVGERVTITRSGQVFAVTLTAEGWLVSLEGEATPDGPSSQVARQP